MDAPYKINLTEDEKEEMAISLRDLYQELQKKVDSLEEAGGVGYTEPLKDAGDLIEKVAMLLSDPFFLKEKESEHQIEQIANRWSSLF